MSTKSRKLLSVRECPYCKETLNVFQTKDGPVAIEQASEKEHVCWNLPADANLIVIEGSPERP